MENLILYDGKCNLCNYTLQFILKRDKLKIFNYLPLQSSQAEEFLKTIRFNQPGIDSVIFIEKGRAYIKSEAFFRIAKKLGGLYKLIAVFRIFPNKFSDWIYDVIAKNRYNWFGENEVCMIDSRQTKQPETLSGPSSKLH
jgi:predicted DCC family thiol-disulfide oxidoreductase YuxK